MSGRFIPNIDVNVPVAAIHTNLDQDVIQITEDRLRLVLKDHLEAAEDRKAWVAPAGIIVTIILAFVTANFRDYGLKADTWEAIFIVSLVLNAFWLINCGWRACKAPSIDDIVSKLKAGSSSSPKNQTSTSPQIISWTSGDQFIGSRPRGDNE